MKDFRDLKVWERGHRLTLEIYKITSGFPREEMYGLTSQMRRSCASIQTNISEGCGRSRDTELARFIEIAIGSASELEYLLQLSRDLALIKEADFRLLIAEAVEVKKMLISFFQKLKANCGKLSALEWGWQYVFPSSRLAVDPRSGKIRRHHISETTVQSAIANAIRKAGIVKHATVHTLRHSFATHLLQSGVNIREIQDLLGHKNVETTMIYMHVLRDMTHAPQSPLDSLYHS
jgi:four helix bundle protein